MLLIACAPEYPTPAVNAYLYAEIQIGSTVSCNGTLVTRSI